MSIFNKQTKQETILYTIVWTIIFIAPLVNLLIFYDDQTELSVMRSLMDTYGTLLTFLILFLIHNYMLAPMLIKYRKMKLYVIGLVTVFFLFQMGHCLHEPSEMPKGAPPIQKTMLDPPPPRGSERPPIDKHDLSIFLIAIMMIGANLGAKSYFHNEENKKHLAKLKEQSLKQQLDYLRYQINPHFIMNTLNNIHALVDIDPDQAKDSIVDMSRMMRYLLYESDKRCVSLHSAIPFLKRYVNLMKLRFSDQVTINLDVPEVEPDEVVIAPLVFIPFVENAFKHGVAYDKPSVIDIDIKREGNRLLFHCHNTKNNVKHEFGGVGLNNVSKRLELIYGNDYCLDIKDNETDYDVLLNLPERCSNDFNDNNCYDSPSND